MKKAFKITAYILLGFLVLLIGALAFFNGQYSKADKEFKRNGGQCNRCR